MAEFLPAAECKLKRCPRYTLEADIGIDIDEQVALNGDLLLLADIEVYSQQQSKNNKNNKNGKNENDENDKKEELSELDNKRCASCRVLIDDTCTASCFQLACQMPRFCGCCFSASIKDDNFSKESSSTISDAMMKDLVRIPVRTRYCSAACQIAHFSDHKKVCCGGGATVQSKTC
jgi:hypothetical protein